MNRMNGANDNDRALSDAFRGVAAEDTGLGASSGIERRLRAEVGSIARSRRRRRVAVASLAAAAALAGAVAVPWKQATDDPGGSANASSGAEPAAVEVATAFFPLSYSGMPVSNAQL